jgi:hypothetical protein
MVKRKPVNYKALVIESGVPIPKKKSSTKRAIFFSGVEVGDSFFSKEKVSIRNDLGYKFTRRVVDGGSAIGE